MHHVILGAGGIGGGIGGRLVQAGFDVTLVARGAHLEAMQRDGLRMRTPEEDVTLEVTAVGEPSAVAWRGDEVVILTVKGQDTETALEQLLAAAGPSVPVVCAQNGVENERVASRRFERVYAMLLNFPATFLTPGEVLLHGTPNSGILDAGRFPGGVDATIEELCEHLEAAHFVARPDPQVMRKKYAKLLMNLGNAVQALADTRGARHIHEALRAEATACLDAAAIDYIPLEELVAIGREHYRSGDIEGAPRGGGSTWQSLARGTGSVEVDYLNGEIALLGTLHGVPTPYNRAVQQLLHELVAAGNAPGSCSLEMIEARARQLGAS
jgi:2-dehydropantoate 2-reductase